MRRQELRGLLREAKARSQIVVAVWADIMKIFTEQKIVMEDKNAR